MFELIKRATQAFKSLKKKATSSPTSNKGCQAVAKPKMLLSLEEMIAIAEREKQKTLANAHAAAASGKGPQPWDRGWFEFQLAIEDDIKEIASTIGWHRTQDFLEVLDWALASPQGKRALAAAGDDTSPWKGTLEMIKELRRPLIDATHEMLSSHAYDLNYTSEAQEDLWKVLSNLPGSLHNITQTES